jgi:hypothetical protein
MLKVPVTPLGKPTTDSVALPLNPARLTLSVMLAPGETERLADETEIVGTLLVPLLTVSATVAVSVMEPETPVTVTLDVPTAAVLEAAKVSVLLPVPVTEAGLNSAVIPSGSPLIVSATAPVKPAASVIVTVLCAADPGATVTAVALILKPGVTLDGIAG